MLASYAIWIFTNFNPKGKYKVIEFKGKFSYKFRMLKKCLKWD